MTCADCRGAGVTKRGVCLKCPAGESFLQRSDGGIRAWFQPEFARALAGGEPDTPHPYLEGGSSSATAIGDIPKRVGPEQAAELWEAQHRPDPELERRLQQSEAAELELHRANEELRRKLAALQQQLELGALPTPGEESPPPAER